MTRDEPEEVIERREYVLAALALNGHGHVVKRADGLLARCGGPAMCEECRADQERLERAK